MAASSASPAAHSETGSGRLRLGAELLPSGGLRHPVGVDAEVGADGAGSSGGTKSDTQMGERFDSLDKTLYHGSNSKSRMYSLLFYATKLTTMGRVVADRRQSVNEERHNHEKTDSGFGYRC